MTRKITRAAAKIHLKMQEKLFLGNLDSERDWGHAKDYVEGMWMMMQQKEGDDFVLATGVKITVRKFVDLAFAEVGVKIRWEGKGVDEKGYNAESGALVVEVDPKYFRPTEVELLIGDASKAKKVLGWEPKYTLQQLVSEMVKCDVKLFERDKYLLDGGHDVMNFHE